MSQFFYHLHIILYTLLYTISFYRITHVLEISNLIHKVVLYLSDSYVGLLLCCHKQIGWIDLVLLKLRHACHGHGIEFFNGIDLVVPEYDSHYGLAVCRSNIHDISFHTKHTS